MIDQDARELHELLLTFMGLYHEKFLTRFRRHDCEVPGLKKNHYKIMGMLSQCDFLMSSEIGRRLDIEKGSITSLIDHLVEKGLVVRRDDPSDRRKSQVFLSQAGREKMNYVIDKHEREVSDLMHCMNEQEIERFLESLRFVVSFMNKI